MTHFWETRSYLGDNDHRRDNDELSNTLLYFCNIVGTMLENNRKRVSSFEETACKKKKTKIGEEMRIVMCMHVYILSYIMYIYIYIYTAYRQEACMCVYTPTHVYIAYT